MVGRLGGGERRAFGADSFHATLKGVMLKIGNVEGEMPFPPPVAEPMPSIRSQSILQLAMPYSRTPRFARRAPGWRKKSITSEVDGRESLWTWHMISASSLSSDIVARSAVSVRSTLLKRRSASADDTGNTART